MDRTPDDFKKFWVGSRDRERKNNPQNSRLFESKLARLISPYYSENKKEFREGSGKWWTFDFANNQITYDGKIMTPINLAGGNLINVEPDENMYDHYILTYQNGADIDRYTCCNEVDEQSGRIKLYPH